MAEKDSRLNNASGEKKISIQEALDKEGEQLHISELQGLNIKDLAKLGKKYKLPDIGKMSKQDLIFAILQAQAEKHGLIFSEGVLEVAARRLRLSAVPGLQLPPRPGRHLHLALADPQVRPAHRRHRLRPDPDAERRGTLPGAGQGGRRQLRAARGGAARRIFYDNLTPLYPHERIRLETVKDNLSARVMDIFTPIGKGQRGLIVSPPRAGKTMLLQNLANSISTNHPEILPDRAC